MPRAEEAALGLFAGDGYWEPGTGSPEHGK
jgi:hypothetical protein